MSKQIIYPGTFDPITNGHIDLIERASGLFSQVVIAVIDNVRKQSLFDLEEREKLTKDVLAKYKNVEVCSFSGLLVDFARERKIKSILRGLRAVSDFEYELQMANVNRILDPEIETVFLTPCEKYAHISSSVVKEISSLGGDISLFVPPAVQKALTQVLHKNATAN